MEYHEILSLDPKDYAKADKIGTWNQFLESMAHANQQEYQCSMDDAFSAAGCYDTAWLEWHKEAIRAGWDPPQVWINSTRDIWPDWWDRRICHDLPAAFDRMVHAGRVMYMTKKEFEKGTP